MASNPNLPKVRLDPSKVNQVLPPDDPTREDVLEYAWELYETYSEGSQRQKRANSGVRQQIIWLIFWTSVLAVITTLPGVRWLLEFLGTYLYAQFPITPDGDTNWWIEGGNVFLRATLAIISVATSAMLAFANQFSPMRAWIMYRVGADRIRSEIYLYRMHAGKYSNMQPETQEIRNEFLKNIELINKQIYEIEAAPPFLQLSDEKDIEFNYSAPRRISERLSNPFKPETKGKISALPSHRTQNGQKVTKLPGRYNVDKDDGFNPLNIEDYINYRVIPQRDWYVKKVYEDYEATKDWRKVILIFGGSSAVLAAIGLEPYIVITTAAAVAINTHIQLNLIGGTYGNYHITASRIDSEIVHWRNLPATEKTNQERISHFVASIESIFEAERSVWMQQASQAQQETEQTLLKGASREGVPSLPENVARYTAPSILVTEASTVVSTPTDSTPTVDADTDVLPNPVPAPRETDISRKLEGTK